ncbi:hypothetical protein [Roseiarcus fermentans]|nr:hypothetical protein [Roseiarcus fermentans]
MTVNALLPVAGPPPSAAERYVLPITAPQDQGDTGLCWVFATLSMLETNYMTRHPGAHVEFSRAALQLDSLADRFRRLARGEAGEFSDGGLAVEAVELIRRNGLLDRGDFHEIVNDDPVFASLKQAFAVTTAPEERESLLDDALRSALGVKPGTTHLEGKPVSPDALARAALGGEGWTEYDLAQDGVEGWGPSHDPEARPETRVRYVKRETLIDLIHASLKRSEAVVVGTVDHAFLVYGADYDRDGKPLAYLVKDSLSPYLYRADAEQLHGRLNDVTVALERDGTSAAMGSPTGQAGAGRL